MKWSKTTKNKKKTLRKLKITNKQQRDPICYNEVSEYKGIIKQFGIIRF